MLMFYVKLTFISLVLSARLWHYFDLKSKVRYMACISSPMVVQLYICLWNVSLLENSNVSFMTKADNHQPQALYDTGVKVIEHCAIYMVFQFITLALRLLHTGSFRLLTWFFSCGSLLRCVNPCLHLLFFPSSPVLSIPYMFPQTPG
jgi:hypothetical protein